MSKSTHVTKVQHKQADINRKAAKHHDQIADAAYFHAEHRGFNGGDPMADWLAAEAEIDLALNQGEVASAH
jgi:Protein of unknown function (DUF2934)